MKHIIINSWQYSPSYITFTLLMETNSNPLFSTIVTLYFLILLYFPHFFLKLVLSPLLIFTLLLVLSVLRLGASQQIQQQQRQQQLLSHSSTNSKASREPDNESDPSPSIKENAHIGPNDRNELKSELQYNRAETRSTSESNTGSVSDLRENPDNEEAEYQPGPITDPKSYHTETFVEWNVWAPLEVIYESYEGEDNDDETQHDHYSKSGLDKYPSLSQYYPEFESSSSSGSSSGSSFDEDFLEEKDGMFEIALDNYGCSDYHERIMMKKFVTKDVEVDEEDNLIEIDISPTRNNNTTNSRDFSW